MVVEILGGWYYPPQNLSSILRGKTYEGLNYDITWDELKEKLELVNRHDIVEMIKKEKIITLRK